MNLKKITDICIKHDISVEELYFLQLLFYKQIPDLYRYSNYTPEEGVLRENPNFPERKANTKIFFVPAYGLPEVHYVQKHRNKDGEFIRNIDGTIKTTIHKNVAYIAGNRAQRSFTATDVESLVHRGFLIPIKGYEVSRKLTDYELSDEMEEILFWDFEEHINELYEAYPNTVVINGKEQLLKGVDRELLSKLYAEAILKNKLLHDEIVSKVKANRDIINMSILNFVKSRSWESLKFTKQDTEERVQAI